MAGSEVLAETKSLMALHEACDLGVVPACHRIAEAFETGRGVPQLPTTARRLYSRACDKDFAPACFSLAGMFQRGDLVADGAESNEEAAKALFTLACKLNYEPGCRAASALEVAPKAGDTDESGDADRDPESDPDSDLEPESDSDSDSDPDSASASDFD